MLFLAALFAAIAVLLFLVEFFKPGAVTGVTNLGLGFFSAGFLCSILDILYATGKV